MQPLLMFLSQTPTLSVPLIWLVLQILDTEDNIKCFFEAGWFFLNFQFDNFILHISSFPQVVYRF